MYKQLLIIGDINLNEELLAEFDYLILPNFELLSLYQGKFNNEIIDFDYLIITSKISKRIMSEDGYIITNNYFETSIDNYFAIGKCIKSDLSLDNQIKIILDYIKGNY